MLKTDGEAPQEGRCGGLGGATLLCGHGSDLLLARCPSSARWFKWRWTEKNLLLEGGVAILVEPLQPRIQVFEHLH